MEGQRPQRPSRSFFKNDEWKNSILRGMIDRSVAYVIQVKTAHPVTQEFMDMMSVHFTDGTTRLFDLRDWEVITRQGKEYWEKENLREEIKGETTA
tara:strand:- start:127 stop:414 length:288 start_codon:yes stop_codon:yes gene_type:complete